MYVTTLPPMPPNRLELNPTVNVWQFKRDNRSAKYFFDTLDDIAEHCCQIWNEIIVAPRRIIPI